MIQFIKPGTKLEFIKTQRIFVSISVVLVLASLVSIATLGFNLGIDFRGGTKLTVAFKGTEPVDRELIRNTVAAEFKKLRPEEDAPQVEVQDFFAGTGTDVARYSIFTEAVGTVSETQKTAVVQAMRDRFGVETVIMPPAEGSDTFFITFETEAPIHERIKELGALFVAQGLKDVDVQSDKVRDMSMEFYKEANLDKVEGASEPEQVLAEVEREQEFVKRLEEFKQSNTDMSYTVRTAELRGKLEAAMLAVPELAQRYSAIESSTSISPSVGADMLADAFLALLYACIGILLYVALRFDFKFAPGGVIALVHDATITLGFFSFLQLPFSMPVVAAVLTVIGYSINDTIVVFDRIRENIGVRRGFAFERIVNISLNETLSRTLLTSLTVMLVLLAIYSLGGGLIKDFAFALIIGVVVGSYSTLFIASPVLLFLHNLIERRVARNLQPAA